MFIFFFNLHRSYPKLLYYLNHHHSTLFVSDSLLIENIFSVGPEILLAHQVTLSNQITPAVVLKTRNQTLLFIVKYHFIDVLKYLFFLFVFLPFKSRVATASYSHEMFGIVQPDALPDTTNQIKMKLCFLLWFFF